MRQVPCEAACYRGFERIAATVDAVDYIDLCNLANVNATMQGELMSVIKRCASVSVRNWTLKTRMLFTLSTSH